MRNKKRVQKNRPNRPSALIIQKSKNGIISILFSRTPSFKQQQQYLEISETLILPVLLLSFFCVAQRNFPPALFVCQLVRIAYILHLSSSIIQFRFLVQIKKQIGVCCSDRLPYPEIPRVFVVVLLPYLPLPQVCA